MRSKLGKKAFSTEVLWPYLLISMMLVLGLLFGVLATRVVHSDQRIQLRMYLDSYIGFIGKKRGLDKASSALLKEALNLNLLKTAAVMVLASLSIVGVPLIAVIAFLRGFILGFGAGFLIQELHLKGGLIFLAGLLPQNLFIFPGLVILGGASVVFSAAICSTLFGRKKRSLMQEVQEYFTKTAVGVLVILLGCFMEAFITPGFLKLLV